MSEIIVATLEFEASSVDITTAETKVKQVRNLTLQHLLRWSNFKMLMFSVENDFLFVFQKADIACLFQEQPSTREGNSWFSPLCDVNRCSEVKLSSFSLNDSNECYKITVFLRYLLQLGSKINFYSPIPKGYQGISGHQ